MREQLVSTPSYTTLKEQLRLFAFDCSPAAAPALPLCVIQELGARERLAALLEGELNFHGQNSSYASHDLHAFAAKFPPQLPRAFIRGLTSPGEVVLDPMVGSGTTIVEAVLEGRRGVGLDLDPLALRLSRVKTAPLDIDELRQAGNRVIAVATGLLAQDELITRNLAHRFDPRTRTFVDYWFLPGTQHELMALLLAIERMADQSVRRFLELTFSSIIVTKSGGVSRARDLAHSRPHRVGAKVPKSAIEQFSFRLRRNLASIAQLETNGASAFPLAGDARRVPLADASVDLVVTSPPYANAIDYMRAHKFSLVWLGDSVADLSELRADYIGSERVAKAATNSLQLPSSPEMIVQQLQYRDPKKAGILRKYFAEMQLVFAEMYRVLRADSAAVVVAGTSIMRGIDVQTHHSLADIAAGVGFEIIGVMQRILDRNKRMMPARFGRKTDSMIEQRIHEEYVIGLYKRASGAQDANP